MIAAVGWRWAPAVGVLVVAAEAVGFVLTGGPPDLVGAGSVGVAAGSWLRAVGVVVAIVAGVVVVCAPRAGARSTG